MMPAFPPIPLARLILILFLALPFQASAFDTLECIQNQQSFGEPSASCAREICAYQECIERTMTTKTSAGFETTDSGASGTARAVCQPHVQTMQACQKTHMPPVPTDAWCSSGNYPEGTAAAIKKALETSVENRSAMVKRLKALRTEIDSSKARKNQLYLFLKSEQAEMAADQTGLSREGNKDKWTRSGRYAAYKQKQAEFGALTARRSRIIADHNALLERYKALKAQIPKAGNAYNSKDCRTAISILGLALEEK